MKILEKKISKEELLQAEYLLEGPMVKAVVDIERKLIGIDSDLHVDIEKMLLENGSQQADLWGINLYPEVDNDEEFIEFDSMINIRPRQGNRTRSVDDVDKQRKIIQVVTTWIGNHD